mmetsp:Transcript_113469/g.219850  ORF Transcript_113469/g.219850 Transcript_113469/m.219850 type:complete len:208 (-) Transcript_113469:249-872(-)
MRAPCNKSLCIDPTTSGNSSAHGLLSQSCTKAMPNTNRIMSSKTRVKLTERNAATMPLTMMSNSGIARSNLAIRAIRVSRKSRASRRTEALPKPPVAPSVANTQTHAMIQVSNTIVVTSSESKTNQASLKQLYFLLKAQKRITNSNEKYVQNNSSTIWKAGGESVNTSPGLRSVSIQIHIAFIAMTKSVTCSNRGCLASHCVKPVFQ